ncbi:Vesicle-associated protein 1-3 [Acorus calamus]|uniref:Vesicle-associated protein 1-3 n=1 Tax=Acorus calamus TaxID=4465 RepID=A0AAV9DS96_ACOCL|nr:Vesicle-associated protein 1-3 [Acorus calamus]
MSLVELLNVQPTELKFPFELKRQSSCSLQLTNKTDQYVAFKVKTTSPKKYCVRPNTGIVMPGMTCIVTVIMQAQKEAPPSMQSKDKFLLQSVVVDAGATIKDLTPELFNKTHGKIVEEVKLRVIYIPANPPSPVPEESEEGSSPRSSSVDNGNEHTFLLDAVSRSFREHKEKPSEAMSIISKLMEEKESVVQQNQKLHQELDLLRKEVSRNHGGGFSIMFVTLICLIGLFIGFIMKRT